MSVADYQELRKLGSGGCGAVWLVRGKQDKRQVSNHDSIYVISVTNVVVSYTRVHKGLFTLREDRACPHGSSSHLVLKALKTPFTRFNPLSERLNKRLNVCLHDAAGCSTGLTIGCIV